MRKPALTVLLLLAASLPLGGCVVGVRPIGPRVVARPGAIWVPAHWHGWRRIPGHWA